MEEIDLSKYGIDESVFNEAQKEQIILGIKNLKNKKVKDDDIKKLIGLYAGLTFGEPEFHEHQMEEIRTGIEILIEYSKYSIDEIIELVGLYADKKFTLEQMTRIGYGVDELAKMGIDKEEIKTLIGLCANEKIDSELINRCVKTIIKLIKNKKDIKYIIENIENIMLLIDLLCANKYFDLEREEQVVWGVINFMDKGKSNDEIKILVSLYANNKFNWSQMLEIRYGIEYLIGKNISVNDIKELISLYADTKFNMLQMRQIRLTIEMGLSKEQVKLIANSNFSANEMASLAFIFSEFGADLPVSKNKFLVFI